MKTSQAPGWSVEKGFIVATLLLVGFILFMKVLTAPLSSGEIISFELAKTTDKALQMISKWTIDDDHLIRKVLFIMNTGCTQVTIKTIYPVRQGV